MGPHNECSAPHCRCADPCSLRQQVADRTEPLILTTTATTVVVARSPRSVEGHKRRARNGILPGDTIKVTRGFEYESGGRRRSYFRREEPAAR